MTLSDLGLVVPGSVRRRLYDQLIEAVAAGSTKVFGRKRADAIRRLRSDGELFAEFDNALTSGLSLFYDEYGAVDREVADQLLSIVVWRSESIRHELIEMLRKPGSWSSRQRSSLVAEIASSLERQIPPSRIDAAVLHLMGCLARQLWHLPMLQGAYQTEFAYLAVSRGVAAAPDLGAARQALGTWSQYALPPATVDGRATPRKLPELWGCPSRPAHFVNRRRHLATITSFWNSPRINVLGVVGWGGVGKSALVRQWVEQQLHTKAESAVEAVFWWSIARSGEVDALLESLLVRLVQGDLTSPLQLSTAAKLHYLARLLSGRRLLVVLDSTEAVQFTNPHDPRFGAFRSPALQDFIALFLSDSGHKSKLVMTSRTEHSDYVSDPSFRTINVEDLSPTDGLRMLKALDPRRPDSDFRDAISLLGSHPLTLTILAGYSKRQVGLTDWLRTPEPNLYPQIVGDSRLNQLLAQYDTTLAHTERALLRVLSTMRTATVESLTSFRTETNGGNRWLADVPADQIPQVLRQLANSDLLKMDAGSGDLHIHPVVRHYYESQIPAGKLKEIRASLSAWSRRRTNSRMVGTLAELQPTIDAFDYACQAGDLTTAFDIWQNDIEYPRWRLQKQFGALELEVSLLTAFFPRADLTKTPPIRDDQSKAVVINQLAYVLNRSGRSLPALPLFGKAAAIRLKADDWTNTPCSYFDLSEALTLLGRLPEAIHAARRAVVTSEKSLVKRQYSAHASLGWALCLSGRLRSARSEYNECDRLESEVSRDPGSVYLADRVHHASFLMEVGDVEAARQLVVQNFAISERLGWADELVSCKRQLGDLERLAGEQATALAQYTAALQGAASTSRADETVLALVGRAQAAVKLGSLEEAKGDLARARAICDEARWLLHLVTIEAVSGEIDLAAGDLASACTRARTAFRLASSLNYPAGKVLAHGLLATIAVTVSNARAERAAASSMAKLRAQMLTG